MKTILVIEDDPDTLNNLALMLEMEGFQTLVADNGRDGVDLARAKLPDLILCDVMMPELDGHGVIAALRGEPATSAIPFIFLTARGERQDLRTGMNLGADDYITKPAEGDEVLAAIRTRLARQSEQERATLDRVEVVTDFSSPLPLQEKFGLTPREAEVLVWMAQGKSNSDIATILGNSEGTVKIHANRIFEKLGVDNRHAATLRALELLSSPRL
jgi:DNA-binding NarL/FixJ family response regulator